MSDAERLAGLHPETLLIQGGSLRSQFGETSEALFLNSGYVYETAEEAEARFKGEAEGYVYSRFCSGESLTDQAYRCLIATVVLLPAGLQPR